MRNYESIEKIQRKYGEPIFKCGLSYLFGKGHENVPDIDINEAKKFFEKQEAEIKAKGNFPIMTVDFQVNLIECAKELAKIDMWDVLAYVKDEVSIYGCKENCTESLLDDIKGIAEMIDNDSTIKGKYQLSAETKRYVDGLKDDIQEIIDKYKDESLEL